MKDCDERRSLPAAAGRPGRITEQESFLDLVDQIAYGDLATWRQLYSSAIVDQKIRANIVRAAQQVDPDFATAGKLWQLLVSRIPTLTAVPDWAADGSALISKGKDAVAQTPPVRNGARALSSG